MKRSIKWEPIGEIGTVLTHRQFERFVKDGDLIDYDGYGEYASRRRKQKSGVKAYPSRVKRRGFDERFTHVVWYNR